MSLSTRHCFNPGDRDMACDGLRQMSPLSLWHLNTWFLADGAVGRVLGSIGLLEGVCPWRQVFRVPFPVCFLVQVCFQLKTYFPARLVLETKVSI